MDMSDLQHRIFHAENTRFEALCMEVFRHQSLHCEVYRRYLECLQLNPSNINHSSQIPFLPIAFFKQHAIKTGGFSPEIIFESSSTTNSGLSRHYVKSVKLYEQAFTGSFDRVFGSHEAYCHLALLPSYLERQHSSLVYQVDYFIRHSQFKNSAFYLNIHDGLKEQLLFNESNNIPTMLWGVSFALLDFAEKHQISLQSTSIIETGGMKGRRKEITREELHGILQSAFSKTHISGEYGMTELMSQAYAVSGGRYSCPPWMRVSAREINDPFSNAAAGRHGVLNIIDLANLDSCAFIGSADLGKVFEDGSFEVLGRIDHSDVRGCNLLV